METLESLTAQRDKHSARWKEVTSRAQAMREQKIRDGEPGANGWQSPEQIAYFEEGKRLERLVAAAKRNKAKQKAAGSTLPQLMELKRQTQAKLDGLARVQQYRGDVHAYHLEQKFTKEMKDLDKRIATVKQGG